MAWRTWLELRDPVRLWVASIVFSVLGAILLVTAASFAGTGARDDDAIVLAVRVLGGSFLSLGLAVLLPMFVSLRISGAERKERLYWWMHFVGGLLGALAFAVPATVAFPIFLFAHLNRPNVLAPDGAKGAENLAIAGLFSVVGLVVLVVLFFFARYLLRTRVLGTASGIEGEIDLGRLGDRGTPR